MNQAQFALTAFVPAFPPRSLASRLVARAVLIPLCGPIAGPDEAVAAGLRVVDRWRGRVWHLAEHGWDMTRAHPPRVCMGADPSLGDPDDPPPAPVLGRTRRMLNCPPSAFLVRDPPPPCTVGAICPHCWGRRALDQWRAIDAALFPPARRRRRRAGDGPRRAEVTLLERHLTYRTRYKDGPRSALDLFLMHRLYKRVPGTGIGDSAIKTRRADLEALRRAGVAGGLEVISPDIATGDGGLPTHWIARVRQILLVPPGDADAIAADARIATSPLARVAVRRVDRPTRPELVAAVARAFRYPSFLLEAPSKVVKACLAAQAGRRMSARFGSLHGASPG